MTAIAGLGHNNPPADLKSGDQLTIELAEQHAAMLARRDELTKAGEDFLADHDRIDDDETSGSVAGLLTQMRELEKRAATTREGIKAPYITAGRIIDGFFKTGISDKLAALHARVNKLQTDYGLAKAEAARRQAEAEAQRKRAEEEARRRAAEEQERIAREAREAEERKTREAEEARQAEVRRQQAAEQKRLDEERAALARQRAATDAAERKALEDQERAARARRRAEEEEARAVAERQRIVAEREAAEQKRKAEEAERAAEAERQEQDRVAAERQRQEKVASSSAADRSRTRGDFAMVSITETWKFRVVDAALVPREFLIINDAAVNAAIRGATGRREIAGLEIFKESKAVNR